VAALQCTWGTACIAARNWPGGPVGYTEFRTCISKCAVWEKIVDPLVGAGEAASCERAVIPYAQQALLRSNTPHGVLDADISGARPRRADGNVDREMTPALRLSQGRCVLVRRSTARRQTTWEDAPARTTGRACRAARPYRAQPRAATHLRRHAPSGRSCRRVRNRGEYTLTAGEAEKVVSLVREVRLDAGWPVVSPRRSPAAL